MRTAVQRALLTIITLFTASIASFAQDKQALVVEALELSGLKESVKVAQTVLAQALEQIPIPTKAGSPQEQEAKLKSKELLSEMLGEMTTEMSTMIFDYFMDHFDQERLTHVLTWLRSPLSRRLTQLELDASGSQGMERAKDFAASLQSHPVPDERMKLIVRLEQAVQLTDFTIRCFAASARTSVRTIEAIEPFLPPEKRIAPEKKVKPEDVERMVRKTMEALEQPMKEGILIHLLYIYRSVSDQELQQYLEHLESDDGRWFTQTSSAGYLFALEVGAEKAMKRLFIKILQLIEEKK